MPPGLHAAFDTLHFGEEMRCSPGGCVIVRYNNGVTSEGVMGTWNPPAWVEDLTEAQKAVITQPHYRGEDKGSALYRPK